MAFLSACVGAIGCSRPPLAPQSDLSSSGDGAMPVEMAAPPDAGVPFDLMLLPDLTMPPDLAAPNDLTPPLDLTPPPPRLVFTTSQLYTAGSLGGLAGADAKCQALADAAGLGGHYMAWLSDNSYTPPARMTHSTGPYQLVNGSLIATDWADLVKGNLRHAIDLDEHGMTPPTNATASTDGVWTDTREDGTIFQGGYTCGEWTDNNGVTGTGRWNDQMYWSLGSSGPSCSSTASLFCFEQ